MAVPQLNAPARAHHGVPQAGVTHIRHRHTERFTVVGNHLAQHAELSAVAIGLAVYIQSKPDGTSVTIKALAARFPEGEVVVARALRELEAAGYLQRTLVRLPNGRRITRTSFHDHPAARTAPPSAPPTPPRKPQPQQDRPSPAPSPDADTTPNSREARHLLTALRVYDPRLVLGARDIARLIPTLTTWLDRGIDPAAAARTLTADLPEGVIHRPAGLLHYRLTESLPPALPLAHLSRSTPTPPPPRPNPLQNCPSCDRAHRAPTPGLCPECAEEAA
ncbi:helix-turn-helix domain-containing protein [Streptomyces sp. DSM 42041]|uniref:Helix-turn-helix domain-containing protein n=1 Tax=Streptomyces hazeniae TaxID=3075538 RepID=A0ABU2NS52_9ACTN|nr:helix-turn-helix domain-containing protein [Streptomyces sp. DSM 42041]MDT0379811.1 helix-turn-helix domain-containing protein [Streptomyces sp. DSM 42041]